MDARRERFPGGSRCLGSVTSFKQSGHRRTCLLRQVLLLIYACIALEFTPFFEWMLTGWSIQKCGPQGFVCWFTWFWLDVVLQDFALRVALWLWWWPSFLAFPAFLVGLGQRCCVNSIVFVSLFLCLFFVLSIFLVGIACLCGGFSGLNVILVGEFDLAQDERCA